MSQSLQTRLLLLATTFSLMAASALQARDVHVFVVADVDDPEIGIDVAHDQLEFTSMMDIGFKSHKTLLHFHYIQSVVNGLGNQAKETLPGTRELYSQIDQSLRNSGKYSRDDAIVFYFSGHGEVRPGSGQGFLLNGKKEFLARRELLAKLKTHSPELLVLLTDSCAKKNGPAPRFAPEAAMPFAPIDPLFRKLFLEAKGIIDVNACTEGQAAWPLTELGYNGERKPGSIFTSVFINTLNENADRTLTWKQVLSMTASSTSRKFKAQYPGGVTDESTFAFQDEQTPQTYQASVTYQPVSLPNINQQQDLFNPQPQQQQQNLPLGIIVKTCEDGVHVVSVTNGTPSTRLVNLANNQTMRLESGDHIIGINNMPVNRHDNFISLLKQSHATPILRVRDGKTGQVIQFQADLRPQNIAFKPPMPAGRRVPLGVRLKNCPDGVHIVDVGANTPASNGRNAQTGEFLRMEAGDHIVSINGVYVSSHTEAGNLINQTSGMIRVNVRDKNTGQVLPFVTSLTVP